MKHTRTHILTEQKKPWVKSKKQKETNRFLEGDTGCE